MRKTRTLLTLQVKIEVPKGSNGSDVMQYVRTAVGTHKGGLDPEDPLFEIGEVTVSLVKKETTYG